MSANALLPAPRTSLSPGGCALRTPSAPRTLGAALGLAALLVLAAPASAGPLEDAKAALAAKQHAKAADVLAPVVEQGGGSREAALLFAQAVTQGKLVEHYALAEDALSKQVKQSDDAGLRTALGEVFLAQAPTREDPKQVEGLYRDAIFQFEKALAVTAGHADAVIGKAQAHYFMGESDVALEALDALPADKPNARAQYWRGKVFYDRAVEAYKADPRAEATKALFRKAKTASEVSAKIEPSFDAWMQYAYAAQYLADSSATSDALDGYAKAMALDPESRYPLLGIRALKTGDDAGYVATLEKLAKDCPVNAVVHLFLGQAHLKDNRWDAAVKALHTFVARSSNPAPGYTALGQALMGQGKEAEAVKAFEQALEKNPEDLAAVMALNDHLQKKHAEAAQTSVKAAKEAEEAFEKLAKSTRFPADVLNNGAFVLREAYGRNKGSSSWKPVLEASVRLYEGAAKWVDEQPQDVVDTAPWATRWVWAQFFSDTALMYQPQFYPENADAGKAEEYYLRALKLTHHGYFDAWNNLRKLYHSQSAFQKIHDLNALAAEGLALEDGTPHKTGRSAAKDEMAKLVADGKAKAE